VNAVRELLNEVRTAGIELEAVGDKLRVRAAAPPSHLLLNKLRSYKPELLRILNGGAVADAEHPLPEHLAGVCLWRVEQPRSPARYMVAGPDHDLRTEWPVAVFLFSRGHRNVVREMTKRDSVDETQRGGISPGGLPITHARLRALQGSEKSAR